MESDPPEEAAGGDEPCQAAPCADTGPGSPGPSPDALPAADAGPVEPGRVETGPAGNALPPKVEAWRRRSATGAILTGFAFGLQEALQSRKEEPAIVMQTSGDPPTDLPVEVELEYGRPRRSVVQIRPWLLGADAPATDAGPETDGGAGGSRQEDGQ